MKRKSTYKELTEERKANNSSRKIRVKKAGENPGFCRKYYKDEKGILYCLQEDQRDKPPKLYYCTPEGEPSTQVYNAYLEVVD